MSLLPPTLLGVRLGDDETIAALQISAGGAGLIIGQDDDGNHLVVQMFGPEPVDYAVLGPLWLRQVLVFRAMALGAHVVVETARPDAWGPFVRVAAGTGGELRCTPRLDRVPYGRPNRPVLALRDSDSALGDAGGAAGPWTAVVSASERATQWNIDDLTRADVVFAAPMPAASASLLSAALALPDGGSGLADLEADQIAIAARGYLSRVRLGITSAERWLTSPVQSSEG